MPQPSLARRVQILERALWASVLIVVNAPIIGMKDTLRARKIERVVGEYSSMIRDQATFGTTSASTCAAAVLGVIWLKFARV